MDISSNHLWVGGKINIWGWILFIATLILIIFAIRQAYAQIKNLEKDETLQKLKMKELEQNVRQLRGNNYVEIRS